jgi:Fic family protein
MDEMISTTAHSNSIEGYDVTLDDAIALLAEDEVLEADQRTVAEVRGHRNAMTYVQQLAADPNFHFDPSLIRSLHFMMLGHDLSKSPGSYRVVEVFVRDEDADEMVYTGPDAGQVPALMEELLAELEHQDGDIDESPIFVTAAMAHLNLVMTHPFRDGDGRMARCLQTMILARSQTLAP